MKNGICSGGTRLTASAATSHEDRPERARVREVVARRGLTSVMNDSRWERLQQLLCDLPFTPPYQYKSVLMEEPFPPSFDEDVGYWGAELSELQPLLAVEWIRFRPRYLKSRGRLIEPEVVDCAYAFRTALAAAGIPFEERDESFWIFGYA